MCLYVNWEPERQVLVEEGEGILVKKQIVWEVYFQNDIIQDDGELGKETAKKYPFQTYHWHSEDFGNRW